VITSSSSVTQRPSKAPPRDRDAVAEPAEASARWSKRITIAALVALVALVTGGANLVYMFWPDLRADPGLQHTAHLAVLGRDANILYSAYLQRPGSTPTVPAPAPGTPGNVFYLQMEMEGFKGKSAKLRWFTYNADNGERLPRPFSTGHSFKAKAPTSRSISEEWVQPPNEPGTHRYWIRFELYDSGDVLLAFADSKPFTTFGFPG
jgi:hypothetical protein